MAESTAGRTVRADPALSADVAPGIRLECRREADPDVPPDAGHQAPEGTTVALVSAVEAALAGPG